MTAYIGIRLSQKDRDKIRAAASLQGVTVNKFVRDAALTAVKLALRAKKVLSWVETVLARARNGQPGYKESGLRFGKSLKRIARHQPGAAGAEAELRLILAVVDQEMLRAAKYKPIFDWCRRYFPDLWRRIPARRRTRFVEGFCSALSIS